MDKQFAMNKTQCYGLETKYFYLLRKGYQLKIQICFVLGFPPFDLKHLEQTWVVLVDSTAPRRTREFFKVFKAAPLNFVGIIPENKGVEARVPVLQEIEPLFYILLEKLICQHQSILWRHWIL